MSRVLVIGHGSVGAVLVRRLVADGQEVLVFDPKPRLAVTGAEHITVAAGPAVDVAICCVVPAAARNALDAVRPMLGVDTLYMDWNTLPPQDKADLAQSASCRFVDVALMDSLDSEAKHPSLAVAGPAAEAAQAFLAGQGYHVTIAGAECGAAARLKLARSLFMKSLEALVLEFNAALTPLDGREVVVDSIGRNLGPQFMDFARMLIETDRVHAGRRARELEGAVAAYRPSTRSLRLAVASIATLHAAADAWGRPDAPLPDASADTLAAYIARTIEPEAHANG